MNNIQWDRKFLSMFLILLCLFVFIFFTQWYYSDLISTMDLKSEKEKILSDKIKMSDKLSKIQKELKKSKWEEWKIIKKYSKNLTENELIKEIYSSVNKNTQNWKMKVLSLSMSEGIKNELWFLESKVNISARFSNKKVMKDFIDYLINDSSYKFFINNFNMPKIEEEEAFNVAIPLVLFYVDIENKIKK